MGKTYADNAMNRRLGRVGMPVGSMPQSSSGSNANVYADNAENRRSNRVGLPHGTAPVSNQRPQSNEANPQARRASPEIRPAEHRSQTRSTSRQCDENERSRKVYVDNAQNRRLNRVGLPYGTTADSIRDLDPSDADCSLHRNDASGKQHWNIKDEDHETCRYGRATGIEDTRKTYTDNAYNRKLGRVGLPHGEAVVKKNEEKHQATDNVARQASPQIPSAENRSKTRSTSDQQGDENERSKKVYVDNAQNRRLNRVGLPYGTTADSVRDLDPRGADCSPHRSDASGRKHWNIKDEDHGACRYDTASGIEDTRKTYADNAYNRKLGRVGLPHGEAVVKRDDAKHHATDNMAREPSHQTPLAEKCSQTRSTSRQCYENERPRKVYVDNAQNRRLTRVGLPYGTTAESARNLDANCSPHRNDASGKQHWNIEDEDHETCRYDTASGIKDTRKTYADNAYNRKLGRVGLPHGEAVVKKNEEKHQATYNETIIYKRQAENRSQTHRLTTDQQSGENERSRKVYVDNPQNRRLNRVGLPYGTTEESARNLDSSDANYFTDRSGTSRRNHWDIEDEDHETYEGGCVDKEGNKTQTITKSYDNETHELNIEDEDQGTYRTDEATEIEDTRKRYVDNAYNRKLGRVGLFHGEAVVYNNEEKPHTGTTRVYVDNPQNRKLGRVGLPLGSKVYLSKTKEITTRTYADTPINRKLGRVGKTLGSMPRRSFITDKINIIMEKWDPEKSDCLDQNKIFEEAEDERYLDDSGVVDDMLSSRDTSKDAMQQIICHQNRQRAENSWKQANQSTDVPKTDMSFLHEYKGKKIDFNELKLHSVIGKGGFGEVYYAKWKETVVAAKIIRSERVSEKALTNFGEEVMKFCEMDHPNIVTFIGACTKRPNLSIVMEYMQFSLYDALHVRQVEFPDEIKLSIIQQICKGMKYLHEKRIAHCDLKSANILMDYVENRVCNVKITDFGLSMIRSHSTISLSRDGTDKVAQYIGTPRYAAPEILRGEILSQRDMLHADVWALALVFFEVIFVDEPYNEFKAPQLKAQVGDLGTPPEISDENMIDYKVLQILYKSWRFEPLERPRINEITEVFNRTVSIYID